MVPTLKRSRVKAQCRGCWLLLHTCEKENSCNTQTEKKERERENSRVWGEKKVKKGEKQYGRREWRETETNGKKREIERDERNIENMGTE